MTLSEEVSRFAAETTRSEMPADVLGAVDHQTSSALVRARDGGDAAIVRAVLETAKACAAPADATVYATGEPTGMTWAAFANGCAAGTTPSGKARRPT